MEENYLIIYMLICGVLGQIYCTYYFFKHLKNPDIETVDLTLCLVGGGLTIGATSVLFIPIFIIYFLIKLIEKLRD